MPSSGIGLSRGSVKHNAVDVNSNGITLGTGSASYNVITRNVGFGLIFNPLTPSANYFGNVLNGNGTPVTGAGINQGQNLCGTAVCPGAQF